MNVQKTCRFTAGFEPLDCRARIDYHRGVR